MNKKIKISELVEKMEMQLEDSVTYYNKLSGKFLFINEDISVVDNDTPIEEVTEWMRDTVSEYRKMLDGDDEHYVTVPDKFEIHEYEIMEKFCHSIETEEIVVQLIHSIKGRGAFQRFKDALNRLGLEQRWYKYKDGVYWRKAKEWCEQYGIDYIDE